jgi:phosphoribosylaminoimidazolecarboxamide formyltransferase / IMP cyclohydrolase
MLAPLDERLPCAYGENAAQAPAALLVTDLDDPLALGRFAQLEGSALSYNNLAELDRQLQTITHMAAAFDRPDAEGASVSLALGTKHGNACGAAAAATPADAIRRMLEGDLRAIFGGCVLLGFAVGAEEAELLISHAVEAPARRLLDLVTAASFSDEAVEILARKHGKCRLLANPALATLGRASLDAGPRTRPVRGGVLEQPNYTFVLDLDAPEIEATAPLSDAQRHDLLLAWAVGATSNSNTITLVRDGALIGNGVGQQDRVGCCALAIARATDAGHAIAGAVAYSDSFFPFPDAPQTLIDAGVSAVFSTSGSVRDDLVRQTFVDAGVPLVQLPDRAARGFFGH